MARTVLTPLLGGEFDAFLLASVGEERNGMTLSLLSTFARLDVDPWEETAALAAMPREKARERLAALISTTTTALANAIGSDVVAARLVALLPDASRINVQAPIAAIRAVGGRPSTSFTLAALAIAVLICMLFYFNAVPWR
jgi:hypothetical protein